MVAIIAVESQRIMQRSSPHPIVMNKGKSGPGSRVCDSSGYIYVSVDPVGISRFFGLGNTDQISFRDMTSDTSYSI